MLALIFLPFLWPTQAQADTQVSNLGETGGQTYIAQRGFATKFTTGSNHGGYTLEGATARFSTEPDSVEAKVRDESFTTLWTLSSVTVTSTGTGDDEVWTAVFDLPSSENATLLPDTTYWLSVEIDTGDIKAAVLTANGQTGSTGWTIADTGSRFKTGSTWSSNGWSGYSLQFSIRGDPVENTASTGKPTVSGTARVGQILTAGMGTIMDTDGLPETFPDDYGFQWIRVYGTTETDIEDATSRTYTLAPKDRHNKVKVRVTFDDDAGTTERAVSNAYPSDGTVLHADATNRAATGKPAISGRPRVTQTLTAGLGTIMDSNGLPDNFPDDYSLQWIRVDGTTETDIEDATSQTYTLAGDDEGKRVKVRVSFIDDLGFDEVLTSTVYPDSTRTMAISDTTSGLVSNLGETGGLLYIAQRGFATKFTTGSNHGGYALDGVTARFKANPGSVEAKVRDDSFTAQWTLSRGTVTSTGSGDDEVWEAEFDLPSSENATLLPDTTYWLSVEIDTGDIKAAVVTADGQTGSAGWTIANTGSRFKTGGTWSSNGWSGYSLQFSIRGGAKENTAASGEPEISGRAPRVGRTLTAGPRHHHGH